MSEEHSVPNKSGRSGRFALAAWNMVSLLACLGILAGLYAVLNRDLPDERVLELGLPPASAEIVARRIGGQLAEEVEFLRLAVAEGDLRLTLEERNELYRGSDEVVRGIISEVDATWRSSFSSAVAPPRPIADNEGARALRRYARLRPAIEVALIADRYGAATASTEVLGQYDFSNEGWFRNTLATGQSAVVPSADVDFAVVLPMPGNAPTPRGVFWAELDPSLLVAEAVAELSALNLSVAVVGRSGRLVYPAADTGSPLPDSMLLDAARSGVPEPVRLESSTGAVVAATASVRAPDFVEVGADLGWTVLVWRPEADLALERSTWIAERLQSFGIALACALVFALLAASALSRPMTRIRRLASAAQAGVEVRDPQRTGLPGVRSAGLATLADLARRGQDLEIESVQLRRGLVDLLRQSGADVPSADADSAARLLSLCRQHVEKREHVLLQLATQVDGLNGAVPSEVGRLSDLLSAQTQRLDSLHSFCRMLADGDGPAPAALRGELEAFREASLAGAAGPERDEDQFAVLNNGVAKASDLVDRIGVLALNASIKAAMVGSGATELGEIVSEIEDLGRHTRESLAESMEILDRWRRESGDEGADPLDGFDALKSALDRDLSLEDSARDPLEAAAASKQSMREATAECEQLCRRAGHHLWVEAELVQRLRDVLGELPLRPGSSDEAGETNRPRARPDDEADA